MSQRITSFHTATAVYLLFLVSPVARAAPSISQVTGTLNHKAVITISGSGFGTKATAAPLVWDDASGSSIHALWGAWPSEIPPYNLEYRAPQRGISLPHSHITRYIAGAHGKRPGGLDVMMYKHFTLPPSFPYYVYASWYQRADDAWVFGEDNNFKTFDYSVGVEPYAHSNWYLCYGPPHPSSTSDVPQWALNDDGDSLISPDMNGHRNWWDHGVNPMSGKWSKVEVELKLTDQNDGFIRVTENASHVVTDYVGPTDKYPGKERTVGIGGFARITGQPNNWRYFADAYLDTTLTRVVLANAANLSQATIVETQVPATWSDSSVDATVNLGQFTQGQTAYLFVFDSTGTHNAQGFAVTAGSGALSGPNAPSNVSVH